MARTEKPKIMKLLEDASGHLPPASHALVAIAKADPDNRRKLLKQIEAREVELEQAFFDFLQRVSGTFITPFDRQDLVALAKEMDDVLAGVHQCADLIVQLQVGPLPGEVLLLIDDVAELVEMVDGCIALLKKPDKLSALWQKASKLSTSAVVHYNSALAEIFATDDDPRLLIKHKLVADQTFEIYNAVHRYLTACGITAIKET